MFVSEMLSHSEIVKEISFRTSRSSGAGGQHVNKVETRVEAIFNIEGSAALSDEQKNKLKSKLRKRLNAAAELIISASESRSQFRNKQIATSKLIETLEAALKPVVKRKLTKIPESVKAKRLKDKKLLSEKKQRRNFDV